MGHHFEPENKRQSMQRKRVTSPPPKKSNAMHTSSGKVKISFFFYHKSPLLIEFLKRGATINIQRYQATIQNPRRAIKSKRPEMLSNGVILLHDKCANSFGDYF
ncbi:histone-lysine N-methyltransferase SETMAR [Trichonephila clavipes]|nr:histone-lysine N-methyltransferase SETMAR [Trichonephila clavipes]